MALARNHVCIYIHVKSKCTATFSPLHLVRRQLTNLYIFFSFQKLMVKAMPRARESVESSSYFKGQNCRSSHKEESVNAELQRTLISLFEK